jgi:glycosyltransferase involved in cell wall biosynthesis
MSAYACEPGLGSEIGVGWHWTLEMSKYFDLWVLTRESNRHTIEPWIATYPEYSNIHFLYFDLPKWARFWKKGMRGVRVYYNIWQTLTNKIVKNTMIENNIDIYHHLTYGNALWKVSSYGQKQFFIWGPVGITETIPSEFTKYYSMTSRLKEMMQRIAKRTLLINFAFRKRCKNANLILCKTEYSMQCIPYPYRNKCIRFTDVAVEMKTKNNCLINFPQNNHINYLTVGTLVGWRGFDVLIEAFTLAIKDRPDIILDIVGAGKEYNRLQNLIERKGMGKHIHLLGKLNMNEYILKMLGCDIVINPCFREGSVTVSFDSMAFSKPLICFNTGGYTQYFSKEYAIIIDRPDSRAMAIKALSEAILKIANNSKLEEMGQKANQAALNFCWEKKGKNIRDLIISHYNGRLK